MLKMTQKTSGVRRTIIAGLAAGFIASSAIVAYAGACQYVAAEQPAYTDLDDQCAELGSNAYCYRTKHGTAETCMGPANNTDCDYGETSTSCQVQRCMCTQNNPAACPDQNSVLWQNIGDAWSCPRQDAYTVTGCG